MANYASLKTAVQNVIKTNGNNEITGASLQQLLISLITSLGAYYVFVDVATPSTNPGTPDQNVMYFASEAGTYSNFDGIVVNDGEACFLCYNGTWTKKVSGAATAAQVPAQGQDDSKIKTEDSNIFSIEDDFGVPVLSVGEQEFAAGKNIRISNNKPEEGQVLQSEGGVYVPKTPAPPAIGTQTSNGGFSIEDNEGFMAISVAPNRFSLGRFIFNALGLNKLHGLVYNGSEFVSGNPDWAGKNFATFGDSVVAINNGDFSGPFSYNLDMPWANRVAAYFGMAKQYGRGVGSQMFRWNNGHGGSVTFVDAVTGEYNSRNDSYNYDNYSGAIPAGCIAVRGSLCSWSRITAMFPASVKDSINAVLLMSHNDAGTGTEVTTELDFISNDKTDPEWAASTQYATYGGDYNISYTKGAIASTIMKMQAWLPQAVIIICTPISGRGTSGQLNMDLTDPGMQALRNAIIEVSNLMSIPCIDVYANCGINGANRTKYISDSIHPYLAAGKDMVARAVIGGMKTILPNF